MSQEMINSLKDVAKEYDKILSGEYFFIEKTNWIVEVGGALTATTDEKGKVYLHTTHYPTQFTQEATFQIMDAEFKDGNENPVIPEIYSRKSWYTQKSKSPKESIRVLEMTEEVNSDEKH